MSELCNQPSSNPVLSIITIVLNDKKGIERTFRSIQSQEYENIEHIVIDGCSSDGTLEVIEKSRNDKTIVVSEKDNGIYDAMNKGLRKMTGDFFQLLNAGDVYEDETVLQDIVNCLMQNPESKIIYGNNSYFDDSGEIVRYWPAGVFKPWKVYLGWLPNHSTVFASSRLISDFGLFDDTYRIAGDSEMLIRWLAKAKIRPFYLDRNFTCMEAGGVSNASVKHMFIALKEVQRAWIQNKIPLGLLAPYFKIIQKIPQKYLVNKYRGKKGKAPFFE